MSWSGRPLRRLYPRRKTSGRSWIDRATPNRVAVPHHDPIHLLSQYPAEGKRRGKGSSLNSAFLTPKPPASSVYVHVLKALSTFTRSISVMTPFPFLAQRHDRLTPISFPGVPRTQRKQLSPRPPVCYPLMEICVTHEGRPPDRWLWWPCRANGRTTKAFFLSGPHASYP
jgi:hypothetical protein